MARKVADWLWDNLISPEGWIELFEEDGRKLVFGCMAGGAIGILAAMLFA